MIIRRISRGCWKIISLLFYSANSFCRLLPAREVVDQLGHCRQHNFNRWDEALLRQVRLACGHLDSRWLKVAAREARAINMWDHDWIYHYIYSPMQGCSHGGSNVLIVKRPEDQARPSSSNRSPVGFLKAGWCHRPLPVLCLLVPAKGLLYSHPLEPARVLLFHSQGTLPSCWSVPSEVLPHLYLVVHCPVVAVELVSVDVIATGLVTMNQRK